MLRVILDGQVCASGVIVVVALVGRSLVGLARANNLSANILRLHPKLLQPRILILLLLQIMILKVLKLPLLPRLLLPSRHHAAILRVLPVTVAAAAAALILFKSHDELLLLHDFQGGRAHGSRLAAKHVLVLHRIEARGHCTHLLSQVALFPRLRRRRLRHATRLIVAEHRLLLAAAIVLEFKFVLHWLRLLVLRFKVAATDRLLLLNHSTPSTISIPLPGPAPTPAILHLHVCLLARLVRSRDGGRLGWFCGLLGGVGFGGVSQLLLDDHKLLLLVLLKLIINLALLHLQASVSGLPVLHLLLLRWRIGLIFHNFWVDFIENCQRNVY